MSDMKELVSVIMPAYNNELYIIEAVRSVINQTYEMWELIIIDDCSTDETYKKIIEIADVDSRISIFKNEQNLGVSETRNKGIMKSNGKWIAFLDSDDLWVSEKLERQMELAMEKKVEFVFSGSSFINRNGDYYRGVYKVPKEVTYQTLRNKNVISCSSALIRKELLIEYKLGDDRMHEDYAVWLKVLRSGVTAHAVNQPLLIYRMSASSKSGNKFKTVKMTYKVFRYIGMNHFYSSFYTTRNIFGSLKKYYQIFLKKK